MHFLQSPPLCVIFRGGLHILDNIDHFLQFAHGQKEVEVFRVQVFHVAYT